MGTPPLNGLDAIERAKYKLRQADMALAYLRNVRTEIAADMRRARPIGDRDLRLDTFFFSFLGLAKSAYNIIYDDQAGLYRDAIHSWRMNVLDYKGRTQFNRMMKLRDKDVHQGRSEGETLPTMIPIERDRDVWMYQQQPNYTLLGIDRPVTEHRTPDGNTVRSYDGLQGTMSLYVKIAGETCEASNACERFKNQLSQLIDALNAANVPPLGPLQRFRLWCKKMLRIRD